MFDGENLLEPTAMALFSREGRTEKGRNEIARESGPDDTRAETEHVHIVVLDRLPRGIAVVADGGADAGKFVCGNGDAGAATAHDDAAIRVSIAQGCGHGFGAVGIIDGSGGVGSEVEHIMALGTEYSGKIAFHFEAGVVCGEGDAHGQLS